MGDGFRLHNHHYLIHADILVHLDGLDAAFGVPGDDYAAVGENVVKKVRALPGILQAKALAF